MRQSFSEAIAYFLDKLAIPTEQWDTLWGEINDFAFGIAGVTSADILEDVQIAILEALEAGTGVEQFKKDFKAIAAKRGWVEGQGFSPYRVQMILTQNTRTAYAAGRWQQMRDPAVLGRRPYWLWRHGDSRNPRLHHKALDGKVFPASEAAFWNVAYPPCGFGCKCRIFALSDRDLSERGIMAETPPSERVTLRDRRTGETVSVPAIRVDGKLEPIVDPGFAYAPGSTPKEQRAKILEQAIERIQDPQLKAIARMRIGQA